MNLSWRQLLVCGVAAGILGYAGYRILYTSKDEEREGKEKERKNNNNDEPIKVNGKKKRKSKKKVKESQNDKDKLEGAALPENIKEMMQECDLPVPDLLKLNPESKQRVFYALLMKGEMLLNRGPQEMGMAIEYFSKAVSLVPNPGEVVAAFEKTLPPPVFNALLDKIQHDIQVKVGEYFTGLAPVGVKFVEKLDVEPGTERKIKLWVPIADKDFTLGSTVLSENSDVSVLSINVNDAVEDHCEYCLQSLDGIEGMACPGCGLHLYCSDTCFIKSADVYHCYFCRPSATVVEAMAELHTVCHENRSSLALLVLRYVAFLLSEELRGNGAINSGPFAHYDHLKPVFKSPTEDDKREAHLLRTIFSETNKNIVDFLSDEIYTSMKATLARHCLAIAPSEDAILSRIECRQVDGTIPTLSFYHIAAHLTHSCDPNVVIFGDSPRHIRIAALKNISSGDKLTLSYLPFISGTSTVERQLHLMRLFGLHCRCPLCEADQVIP